MKRNVFAAVAGLAVVVGVSVGAAPLVAKKPALEAVAVTDLNVFQRPARGSDSLPTEMAGFGLLNELDTRKIGRNVVLASRFVGSHSGARLWIAPGKNEHVCLASVQGRGARAVKHAHCGPIQNLVETGTVLFAFGLADGTQDMVVAGVARNDAVDVDVDGTATPVKGNVFVLRVPSKKLTLRIRHASGKVTRSSLDLRMPTP